MVSEKIFLSASLNLCKLSSISEPVRVFEGKLAAYRILILHFMTCCGDFTGNCSRSVEEAGVRCSQLSQPHVALCGGI